MKAKKLSTLFFLLANASLVLADNSYLSSAESVESATTEPKNSIGLGFAYSQNIYDGVDNKLHPIPLLNLTYEDFFVKGFTAGYNLYKDPNLSFALVAQPTFGGYHASDSDALAGMDDTSYLFNTGAQVQYRLMPFSLTLAALHDISGHTGGNSASAKLAAMVPLDDRRFVLIPSIGTEWQSSDITDYYYGVSSHEANDSRPEYNPASAWNMQYGLTFKYQISEHFGSTLSYVLTQYAKDISDSPIVSRSNSSALLAGISYIF